MPKEKTEEQVEVNGEFGVHIQMMERLLKSDPTIARLEVAIFPLPAGELVKELGDHIQKAAHAFLLSKDMVQEVAIDMHAKGTIQ